MTIYNSLQPAEPLVIDEEKTPPPKRAKMAAFKFVQACLKDLQLLPGECFVISDLFGNDTTGFVKVTQVINIVLDQAEEKGLLLEADHAGENGTEPSSTPAPAGKLSYREHVVRELVDTERKYVQDLENLHDLKKIIEEKGVIPGDVVHDIFLNINAILDFQRRFLIKIETTNSKPEAEQKWGASFKDYEDAFGIYQPFIANQRKAADIAKREFDKISQADHPVVVDFNTLDGFLLKPMQRLVKYPMLLKDLRDKTGADDETKADLTSGIESSNKVLGRANAAVDKELRSEALQELIVRVDDWKQHQVDQFGDLLLHGVFTVVTGKSDVEKEYTIYLFERILLCCKEINPNKKQKDKLKLDKKAPDKRATTGSYKGSKLQLKGRIFMTNVTDVISLVKPGSYTVQIWWKGDPGVENFIIRFSNEEVMKKWSAGVDGQRKQFSSPALPPGAQEATPNFAWMQEQAGALPNPYAEEEDDEPEPQDPYPNYPNGQSGFAMSRNASSSSLRSRSTTGDSTQSLAGIARAAPPRFPMGTMQPPLSVQTQVPGQLSPNRGAPAADSYFSPVAESPMSSRISNGGTPSSMFPFPRQATTPGGTWEDPNPGNRYELNRNTAPAMARGITRENQNSGNPYQNGRNGQRTSQTSPGRDAQQRSRSFSTPDLNNVNGMPTRRPTNQAQVPAVPGIPAHLHPAYDSAIPRSNSNSPQNGLPSSNGLPMRSSTQSPGAQRDRLNQFPPQPVYQRANSTTPHLANLPPPPSDPRAPALSPPLNSAPLSGPGDVQLPTQLKVKVNCDGNYVTLVVAFNITYQSLIDRIDAKVGRFSNNAIARGTMRLRYQDEDGDFVTIESDDDIQIAFQEWREMSKYQYTTGSLGEIELFCASVDHTN